MTEPWHDECRRLRAEGLSQPEIALRVNQSTYLVRVALNETDEQKKNVKRIMERRRKPRAQAAKKTGGKFLTYWARAATPGAITPEIKQAAILAFSKHEIDRGELMRRITPLNKWRAGGLWRVE